MIEWNSRLALLLVALALQTACSSQETKTPDGSDLPRESAAVQDIGENPVTLHRPQKKVMRAITPHAAGHGASRSDQKASDYLKAEEMYIGEGGIEADAIDQVLQSRKAFANAVQALDTEGVRSMEAQDMTRLYRTVMEQALGKDVAVSSLACGLSVCLGSVQKGSEFDDSWAHTFLDHKAIKVFGFAQAEDRLGHTHERRFLFSMDPELPAVIVHLAP